MVMTTVAKAKRGKKSKTPDNRAARARYWTRRTLECRKVNNMLKNRQTKKKGGDPMTRKECVEFWRKSRKGRVPDNYIRREVA